MKQPGADQNGETRKDKIKRKGERKMLLTVKSMKDKSKEIIKKAQADYYTAKEQDKNEKQMTLRPGETLSFPNYDGFYFSENRDKCDDILSGYRSQINKMLEEVRTEVKTKSAEPPTSEQANLLTALNIGEPTETEILNALETHSGNFATYSALQRIANKNGYHFDDKLNPLNDLLSLQSTLATDVNKLYVSNAETGLNPAAVQFAEQMAGIFGE